MRGRLSADIKEEIRQRIDLVELAGAHVALKKAGRHKVVICTNLPCALSGANEAADHLKKCLGLEAFNQTSADGKVTLKEGECLGACGDAPVLVLDNKRMCSFMSNDKLDKLLEELD